MSENGLPHAIVVGGSGMLAAASLGLAARGFGVSVVARNVRRLAKLEAAARAAGGRLRPVSVDYRDTGALEFALGEASLALGPPSLLVVWAHGTAPHAPLLVARHAARFGCEFEFVHVLGSATADPSGADDGRVAAFAAVPGLAYREVLLGFVRERGRSRWLTDDEISAGVLGAVASHAPRTIVGVVEPWSERP